MEILKHDKGVKILMTHLCCTHTGSGLLIGLELMRATVSEGESLECCVVIISGTAETEHVLITGSVPFTATGSF